MSHCALQDGKRMLGFVWDAPSPLWQPPVGRRKGKKKTLRHPSSTLEELYRLSLWWVSLTPGVHPLYVFTRLDVRLLCESLQAGPTFSIRPFRSRLDEWWLNNKKSYLAFGQDAFNKMYIFLTLTLFHIHQHKILSRTIRPAQKLQYEIWQRELRANKRHALPSYRFLAVAYSSFSAFLADRHVRRARSRWVMGGTSLLGVSDFGKKKNNNTWFHMWKPWLYPATGIFLSV